MLVHQILICCDGWVDTCWIWYDQSLDRLRVLCWMQLGKIGWCCDEKMKGGVGVRRCLYTRLQHRSPRTTLIHSRQSHHHAIVIAQVCSVGIIHWHCLEEKDLKESNLLHPTLSNILVTLGSLWKYHSKSDSTYLRLSYSFARPDQVIRIFIQLKYQKIEQVNGVHSPQIPAPQFYKSRRHLSLLLTQLLISNNPTLSA